MAGQAIQVQQSKLVAKPLTIAPASLNPQTQGLAARQAVQDLVGQNRNNPGITPVESGKVIGFLPIPPTITATITNGDNAAHTINFFNNSDFAALPQNVTAQYSDGFGGKLISRLMNGLQDANGLLVYGFNVTGYDSGGVKSDAVLNAANLQAIYYNGVNGGSIPAPISIAGSERNTQFKDGLLTVKTMITMNMVFQMQCYLGAGEKLQFVFFTQPLED